MSTYEPQEAGVYSLADRVVIVYRFPDQASREFGCPERFDLILKEAGKQLYFDLAWFDKAANRIAETIWVGFRPIAKEKTIRKLGQAIDPKRVVRNGQCRLHGTDVGVIWKNLSIETLDAALVAPQEPSILHFCNHKPEDEDGIYFNLYNNVWWTNFPQWFEEDARFRFVLKLN